MKKPEIRSQKPEARKQKRKRYDEDTERARLIKASARLLRDLDKFEYPPASVAVPTTPIPLRIRPEAGSGCRSPAATCAEWGWKWTD